MRREKRRQIARDRRIGRIGQAKFLKAGPPRERLLIEPDARKEAIDQQLLHFVASQLDLHRPADQSRAASPAG